MWDSAPQSGRPVVPIGIRTGASVSHFAQVSGAIAELGRTPAPACVVSVRHLKLAARGVAAFSRTSEGRRLAQRAVWSQPSGSRKTARSVALRGGLIEGHAGGRPTRMPIVRNWEGRRTRTAATTRPGRSVASFFRLTEPARGARCRPSARSRVETNFISRRSAEAFALRERVDGRENTKSEV